MWPGKREHGNRIVCHDSRGEVYSDRPPGLYYAFFKRGDDMGLQETISKMKSDIARLEAQHIALKSGAAVPTVSELAQQGKPPVLEALSSGEGQDASESLVALGAIQAMTKMIHELRDGVRSLRGQMDAWCAETLTLSKIDNHIKGFVGPGRGSSGGLCPPDPLEFIALGRLLGMSARLERQGRVTLPHTPPASALRSLSSVALSSGQVISIIPRASRARAIIAK